MSYINMHHHMTFFPFGSIGMTSYIFFPYFVKNLFRNYGWRPADNGNIWENEIVLSPFKYSIRSDSELKNSDKTGEAIAKIVISISKHTLFGKGKLKLGRKC